MSTGRQAEDGGDVDEDVMSGLLKTLEIFFLGHSQKPCWAVDVFV
jgi:hypothetical protein